MQQEEFHCYCVVNNTHISTYKDFEKELIYIRIRVPQDIGNTFQETHLLYRDSVKYNGTYLSTKNFINT